MFTLAEVVNGLRMMILGSKFTMSIMKELRYTRNLPIWAIQTSSDWQSWTNSYTER